MANDTISESMSDISDHSFEFSDVPSESEEGSELDLGGQLLIRGTQPYQDEPTVTDRLERHGRGGRSSTGRCDTTITNPTTTSDRLGNKDW